MRGTPWNRLRRATGVVPLRGEGSDTQCAANRGSYFNQPRLRKYHIGTSALATIRASA